MKMKARTYLMIGTLCVGMVMASTSKVPMNVWGATTENMSQAVIGDDVVSIQTRLTYEKTLVKYYRYKSTIPSSIQYQEYDSGTGVTMVGTLYLSIITLTSTGTYRATFVGELNGYV